VVTAMPKYVATLSSGTRGVLRSERAPSHAAAVELMRRLVDDVADIEAENRWLPSEAIIIKIEQDDGAGAGQQRGPFEVQLLVARREAMGAALPLSSHPTGPYHFCYKAILSCPCLRCVRGG